MILFTPSDEAIDFTENIVPSYIIEIRADIFPDPIILSSFPGCSKGVIFL